MPTMSSARQLGIGSIKLKSRLQSQVRKEEHDNLHAPLALAAWEKNQGIGGLGRHVTQIYRMSSPNGSKTIPKCVD